jgi:hypothetical protein
MSIVERAERRVSNLSMGKKLYGLAGVLVASIVLVGLLGLVNLSSSASSGSDMYRNATLPIEHLGEARAQLANVDTGLLRALRTTSGASQDIAATQSASGSSPTQCAHTPPRRCPPPSGARTRRFSLTGPKLCDRPRRRSRLPHRSSPATPRRSTAS